MTKQVPKSTEKYTQVAKSTKHTQKFINVRRDHSFFYRGTTKVAKNTQNEQKVPKSTQKYRKILKITHKYPKVPKSTQKYQKVLKST